MAFIRIANDCLLRIDMESIFQRNSLRYFQ